MNLQPVDLGTLQIGDTLHLSNDGAGRFGRVHKVDIDQKDPMNTIVTLQHGENPGDHPDSVHRWGDYQEHEIEVPLDADECLNYGPDGKGPVDYWYSGGLNGRSWPRCDFHGQERLRQHDESIEKYADSDVAPSWFDPSYAGERWDDDY